jgi:lipopolysaccharide/colanic/teichoic acid biosynthesis glycosyltransferase
MKTRRTRKLLFLLSDLIALNLAFFAVASFFVFSVQYSGGTWGDVLDLLILANLYLTVPWVVIFWPFGFYDKTLGLSFFQIFLAVTTGILLLKFFIIITDVVSGNPPNVIPTSSGFKLIVLYWFFLMIAIYVIRAFFDFLDRGIKSAHPEVIEGAGYSEKSYGISQSYALVSYPFSYIAVKRLMDFAGAVAAFLVFLPSIIIISLIIKITDPAGGVFFRQYRLGKHGRVFRIFKFRTMVHNAEEMLKKNRELYEEYLRNNFKLPGDRDPRITTIGAFLRKTSLDELPQIFNVLKGNMSLVGPRPIVVDEIIKYDKYTKKFLSVKPGITGWWQVAGRSNIDYPDRIYLEMYYVEKASLFFDLKILIETVPTVLFGKGAH